MTTPVRTWKRSRLLVVLGVLAALVLLALPVVRLVLPSSSPDPSRPDDEVVTITDVAFTPSDTSYTVATVEAVTRGDDGFLRLRLEWFDDPDDSSDTRMIPAFSAEVLHGGRYPGITTVCGLPAPAEIPAEVVTETVELPCSGLLVPTDVASVTLRD